MSKTLATTVATGDSMRVTTKHVHRHDGRAQIIVTVFAYDGNRYHRAQQRTMSYDYSAHDAHRAAIKAAFERTDLYIHNVSNTPDRRSYEVATGNVR